MKQLYPSNNVNFKEVNVLKSGWVIKELKQINAFINNVISD